MSQPDSIKIVRVGENGQGTELKYKLVIIGDDRAGETKLLLHERLPKPKVEPVPLNPDQFEANLKGVARKCARKILKKTSFSRPIEPFLLPLDLPIRASDQATFLGMIHSIVTVKIAEQPLLKGRSVECHLQDKAVLVSLI